MDVFIGILIALVLLYVFFRIGIWLGGRKLKSVDPQEWIIFPDGEDSTNQRILKFEGTHNFRDIGGYPTIDGKCIRWGIIYRTDELNELSLSDLEKFSTLGIRSVYDLRTTQEREKRPNILPNSTTKQVHLPIYESEPRTDFAKAIFFRRHTLGDLMAASYISGFEHRIEKYADILSQFAEPENLPALYHCVAGKDRTGIVTALLLSILGVPKETIIADYSLSNLGFDQYFREFVAESHIPMMGVPNEEIKVLFMVNPAWMQGFLKHIETEYGSVENCLIQKGGLDKETINKIRENLLA